MLRAMHRLAVLGIVLAACGAETDDRPLTLPYITNAILVPTCAAATCHSDFKRARGIVLDSALDVRKTLVTSGLVTIGTSEEPGDEANPRDSAFIHWLTDTDPFQLGIGRMPYDAPMPDGDVALIEHWIARGAPGAQCLPEDGNVCLGTELFACGLDGNRKLIENCDDRPASVFMDPNAISAWQCNRVGGEAKCVETCLTTNAMPPHLCNGL